VYGILWSVSSKLGVIVLVIYTAIMFVIPRWNSNFYRTQCFFICPVFHFLLFCTSLFKVKLSLCFNWAPCHEGVLWEWRYSSTHSLTSALDGGEWSASRPGRFTPKERASGTLWIGDWVSPRAVLDAAVKRKIPSPRRESNPRTTIVHPVAQRCTDWAIAAVLACLFSWKCSCL
jgi:hypothetical protein